MSNVYQAFFMTIELWAFLGILCVAMAIEGLIKFYKKKTVDNPALK